MSPDARIRGGRLMQSRGRDACEAFPAATLEALFDAVEVNDVVDAEVSLPDAIAAASTDDMVHRCFWLAWQFWLAGVRRRDLLALLATLARRGDLDPADRRRYKSIRARYKQLRFALVLYGVRHREPLLLGLTVKALGSLQDAFRYGQRRRIRQYRWLLRVLLASPVWQFVRRRAGAVRLDTAGGFLAYRKREIGRLRQLLQRPLLTGREFHRVRKIVSRQVAFYDHVRTLEADDQAYRLSRFLSAINGLMGSQHDVMVRQDLAGERDYDCPLPLPRELRWRLEAFVAAWPD